MDRMCDSFYAKVLLSVNFLKRFFWKACLQREFVIQDFLFTQMGKIPRKGHLNDLSNEYKIISVSRRIFSKKKDF